MAAMTSHPNRRGGAARNCSFFKYYASDASYVYMYMYLVSSCTAAPNRSGTHVSTISILFSACWVCLAFSVYSIVPIRRTPDRFIRSPTLAEIAGAYHFSQLEHVSDLTVISSPHKTTWRQYYGIIHPPPLTRAVSLVSPESKELVIQKRAKMQGPEQRIGALL